MILEFLQIFQQIRVSGNCVLDESNSLISLGAAPSLLLYSYVPAIIISLTLSVIIFRHNKKDNSAKAFLFFSIFYSLWVINAILQWVFIPNNLLFFVWHLNALFEVAFYLSALILLISFINKGLISLKIKKIFIFVISLVLFLTPSILNIKHYDYENCEGVLGIIWNIIYIFEFLISFLILFYGIISSKKKENKLRKKEILLFSVSLFFFITLFTLSNISGSFLEDYSFELFGPIGMVIFIAFVSYLIVKYQSFNMKLIAAQALVWGIVILIGSQFFFIKVVVNFILNGITFLGIIIIGKYLIASVKKEIEQRELLESLTLRLEKSNSNLGIANEKLKGLDKLKTEFVSLASHQLRSPLTAIKGYTPMLLEGDYGEINKEAKEIIERVMESSNNLTIVVEDLLNISKIESGGMKYEMIKFDLGELVLKTSEELSITAESKGLKLFCNISNKDNYFINADKDKLRQVLVNIIDNSMKYTPDGEIIVDIKKSNNKIILSVKDTGIGINPETKNNLFEKFSRGDGSKLNAGGSGLGLYLVKEIIKAHKGRVWVESEGIGKGSTFFVELDETK